MADRAPKKVEVTWIDSCSHKGAWLSDEEARAWGGDGAPCVSAGFLVARTARGVTLAVSRNENLDGVSWGGLWFIPGGCIRKVRVIR